MRFRRKVLHGEKLGHRLGFPTINFHVGHFGEHFVPGIYACQLQWSVASGQWPAKKNKKLATSHSPLTTYRGALYFGPKGTGKNVLEIHILDFSGDLYGQYVSFEVGQKIRDPKKPKDLHDLKAMINLDIQKIRALPESV